MAGETQISSLSGTSLAKIIDILIIAYQFDEAVITALLRFKSIADEYTDTAAFPRLVKSTGPTAGTPTDETTALTPTELTTTSVDVAVGRVGIARELTETAREDSIVGRTLYIQGFVEDAARLYGEFFDTATTALWSSITTIKGAAGTALTTATMVDVVGSQRVSKARGPKAISLHDHQLKQLQQDQSATLSTSWERFFSPGDGSQFGGYFMGHPILASGLNPTSSGDRLGAMFSIGNGPGARPEYCGAAFVVKRMPSSKTESNILKDSNYWASFSRTGVGIVANNFLTGIRSVNS
jgi:hypothetical protein